MGKKLLLKVVYIFFILISFSSFKAYSQCTTNPTVSIQPNGSTTICSFEDITFYVSAFTPGSSSSYTYTWQRYSGGSWSDITSGSGYPITTGSSGTTITLDGETQISNGDRIRIKVVATCDSGDITIYSDYHTVTVNNERNPQVNISASETNICFGETIDFSAAPIEGGTSPSYEWFVDGNSVGNNSSTFSASNLSSGNHSINVKMTSNAPCAAPPTVTSNTIDITVNPLITPQVSIISDHNDICEGEEVTFNATPVDGGNNPQYQWYVGGNPVGSNSATFKTSTLGVGSQNVYVEMTSNIACVDDSSNPVQSNSIDVQVNPLQIPSVSISTTDTDNTICDGASITFNATPGNEGDNPQYNWKVNGSAVSTTTTPTFSTSGLSDGDIVSVELVSDIECVDPALNPAESTGIEITVNPILIPAITISTDNNLICSGSVVNFTSNLTDGGSNPEYQWYVNGSPAGTSSSFSPNDLPVGTNVQVYLEVTNNDECIAAGKNVITSSIIEVEVISGIAAQPGIITGPTAICPVADNLNFSIAEVTGATSYEWELPTGWIFKEGGDNDGTAVTVKATNNSVRGSNFIKVRTSNICGTSDWQQLQVDVEDFVEVQAGEDQTVCQDITSIDLTGTASFGNGNAGKLNPRWEPVTAGGTLNNPTDLANATYTPGGADGPASPVTLRIITDAPKGACQAGADEMTIYFYEDASVSSISSAFSVCQSGEINLSGTIGGSAETATWTANPSTAGTFNDANSLTPLFTPDASFIGDITFTLTASGPCSPDATDTVVVTVDEASSVNAGEDFSICSTEAAALSGSFTGASGTGIQWTTNGDGSFSSSTSSTSTYTPGTNDIANGSVTLTITTTGSPTTCGEISDEVVVTVFKQPTVEINPNTAAICQDETYDITATLTGDYDTGTWATTGDGTFSNASSATSTYTPGSTDISNGNVDLTYTVQPNNTNCAEAYATLTLTLEPLPVIEEWSDQVICSNSTLTLNGANITGGASQGQWEIVSGGGSLSSTTMSVNYKDVVYTPPSNQAANIVLRLTTEDPAGNCPSVSYDLNVSVNKEPLITTQPSNVGVCSTEPSELSVVASGDNLNYQWYKEGAPVGPNSPTLSFSNTTSSNAGSYYVEVSGADSCSLVTSETVTINVDENIVITAPARDVSVCGDGLSEAIFDFIAHANGAELSFAWLKDGNPLDINSDPDLTFDPPTRDGNGVYEGSLVISNIGNDDAYNGNYQVQITGPDGFSCSTATSNTFYLRINQFPDDPQVEDITYCQFDTPEPLSVISGTNLKWYASETGDDLFTDTSGYPINPTPSTDDFGETTYWVTQTPDVCESNRVPVKVIVKEKPAVPETEASVSLCHNSTAEPLSATPVSDATLNWYDADSNFIGNTAPTPDTQTVTSSPIIYYVSQTLPNECESDLVEISVTVNALPEVTASNDDEIICEGNSTTLRAGGATSYIWMEGETEIGTSADISVSPTINTTYTVIGTDSNGCVNSAEIEVQVDPPSEGGLLSGPSSICIDGSGSITLSDYIGEIQRWEQSVDNGASWTTIDETSEILTIENYTVASTYRAVVKSGVCNEANSEEISIGVDPLPEGGELNWVGVGRIFSICEVQDPGYAVDIQLTGITGSIEKWEYRASNQTTWTTIIENGETFQGDVLSAGKIESLIGDRSTVFRVEITSGACPDPVYSETAILSIISSEILPEPVTVDPDVICFGDEVRLTAESGYTSGSTISEDGLFDNAGITNNGWRVTLEGDVVGFDTDANNTRPDRWKRATDHPLTTAELTSPYNYQDVFWATGIQDGNKGFGVVSSGNNSTIETPVFGIDDMDAALLTFDQAYNLTPGAYISVEISTDGGATYEQTPLYVRGVPADSEEGITSGNFADFALGTVEDRPENKIELDLGPYLGETNLRIRFNYQGSQIGDVWAIDNIDFADGPQGASQVWTDYTDPDNPVIIGTSNTETWIPTLIGWNTFEFKTTLVYNSNGESCPVTEHAKSVKVFAFDEYTVTTTAEEGECGSNSIILSASVIGAFQGEITSYPTLDGYTGQWEITGPADYTFSESHLTNENDNLAAINDPNAVFIPDTFGSYTFKWTLTPTAVDENDLLIENTGCPPVMNEVPILIEECFALDFDGVDDYVDAGTNYTGFYSLEAWVRPESGNGTIISKRDQHNGGDGYELELNNGKPVFRWNGGVLTSSQAIDINDRWYHIAVSFNGTSATLYIDGIKVVDRTTGSAATNSTAPLLIGASGDINTGIPTNYFSGWIEEVRIWNTEITQEQIQFMMNQHLQNEANMGMEIPMPVPGGLAYSDLAGYYRLISSDPDPANLETFDASLMPANGLTPDLALNSVPATLNNMTTNQQNTAPLPYLSGVDGPWTSVSTWLRPTVWDIPNANGVNGDPIEWNIVRTFHDITSQAKDITVLGLKSETVGKELTIANPAGPMDETNAGQFIRVTHYLWLDGNMDLVGESQLLQDEGSILEENSNGWLERDQQGRLSSFNYNYWSSPVSVQGSANNSGYVLNSVLLDGTISGNPQSINFNLWEFAADGAKTNPITISSYWIWDFRGGEADIYGDWTHLGEDGTAYTGSGYSMKGTDGTVGLGLFQNYVFRGKPHNGTINLSIGANQNYLVGNPYPSSIDAYEFIKDNLKDVSGGRNTQNVFNGVIYLWDHFANQTHLLEEYIGGYATYTLAGGVKAISVDERINATMDESSKIPQRYIPVAQGFFLNSTTDEAMTNVGITIDGGSISFKNSQRVYKRENNGDPSIFLIHEDRFKSSQTSSTRSSEDDRAKIRLKFQSPAGYHRQILVTRDPNTSNNFDLGYDAPLIENNAEDMYWLVNNSPYVIQAVPDFEKDQVLPLAIKTQAEGQFTVKIDSTENWPADKQIYLKDKKLDSIHDILDEAYVGTSDTGEIKDRFELVFFKAALDPDIADPGTLPVIDGVGISYSNNRKEIMIANESMLDVSKVMIFDMNGKLVQEFDEFPSQREILLGMRPVRAGVYIIKVFSENAVSNKKIIVN
ncbi:LamG-like jellyroll fold domain-containing protein [Gramella sp. KN1008]|uniref:Ig-like domain-containing protein n=1 Tax=Gramella sp. KN1008 TaxID=2529298 RepID=UPI00103E668E|nr:LamG-like jellyroll fold domain-containing protein [Gramella sp. KN1008]TBW30376.1 T9SS type A sorting domain-containing protein [Gramella sp. KN1008]